MLSDTELKYAIERGIIDVTDARKQIDMTKRKEILKEHEDMIWHSSDGHWYCYLPDNTKPRNRRKIKRVTREAIEKVLIDFYLKEKEREREQKRRDDMTLEELYNEFMDYKEEMVCSNTIRRMEADWRRFYEPCEELIHKPYKEITKVDIDKFMNQTVNKRNLSSKCFHNMCGIIKQIFNYAVDAEYIEKSPYRVNVNKKKVVRAKKKENTTEIFFPDEQKLILDEMERRLRNNPTNTAPLAIKLDFELGVRKGELLALRYSDIKDGKIHVQRQVVEDFDISDLKHITSKGFNIVNYTKSDDGDREIPLTATALDLIHRIKKINRDSGEFFMDYMFVRDSYIMSPDAIDTQLRRGCQYVGIPVRTPHKIRKTYASILFNKGIPLDRIRYLLGHADEATTMKFYVFSRMEDDEETESVISALEENSEEIQKVTKGDSTIITFNEDEIRRKA